MASTLTSHRLLARLHRDLAELVERPYPGVAVFIDDADIRKICLVLTPPAGPWKGLALHFDVNLPHSWPSAPPSVSSSVGGIAHPNLFNQYICCDLLEPTPSYDTGYTGGYTPAFTLRGLFLQFLTFFSSTSVEQDYGGAIEIGDSSVTIYRLEQDIADAQFPWKTCNHNTCSCDSTGTNQLDLERKWRNDPRPEVEVLGYDCPTGRVTHKAKGAKPGPKRLHKFEKRNPRWRSTLGLISKWTCTKCPYGSAELPHESGSSSVVSCTSDALGSLTALNIGWQPPKDCALHHLNDDVLLEIAAHIESESLVTFGRAYPRFRNLITSHHVFLLRELQCFFLKTPLNQGILGVGVSLENGAFSSDFDWLSLEAFDEHDVRQSILKRRFQLFLPLAFNRGHFDRARTEIWSRVAMMDTAARQADADRQQQRENGRANGRGRGGGRGRGRGRGGSHAVAPTSSISVPPRAQPHEIFDVLYKMMNNIVVSLMKSCDDALSSSARHHHTNGSPQIILNASEKAVIAYCHLIHLLSCICRSHPAVLHAATERVRTFLKVPSSRTKVHTPDMGELIVVITLVLIMTPPVQAVQEGSTTKNASGPSWSILNGPFLEEAIIRNVRWVLKDAPELEVMTTEEVESDKEIKEGGAVGTSSDDYRLTTTFKKSKTSLRLIMFQITFLDMFIGTYHPIGIQALDQNYGFPEPHLPEKMVDEIKEIYEVETWPDFFEKVRYAKATGPGGFTKARFAGMLRSAVRTSAERGYHTPVRLQALEKLKRVRRELEREAQTRL